MTFVKWVVLKCDVQPSVMICERCDYKQEVRLPLPVDQAVDILNGFARRHQDCKPQPVPSGKARP